MEELIGQIGALKEAQEAQEALFLQSRLQSRLQRDREEMLTAQINALIEEINALIWGQIKPGVVLTDGKRELTVVSKWDDEFRTNPDMDDGFTRPVLYKSWISLNGYLYNSGWRVKTDTIDEADAEKTNPRTNGTN